MVAGVIASESPDIVLLNEARFRWRLRGLARRLGMEHTSGLTWPRPVTNAVLARRPWRIGSARRVLLPRLRTRKRRGLVVAALRGPEGPLSAAVVHLGLSDPERIEHARLVTDALAGEGRRVVLGGDLNEDPERPAARWLAERYWDAFGRSGAGEGLTFPAREPRARIDYLFVSEGLSVEAVRTVEGSSAASDHLAVVADLEISGDPAAR